MKKVFPYFLIILAFVLLLLTKYPGVFSYSFNQNTVINYLRSQDIEDPASRIKDRLIISDSDIYSATGYLYAKGEDPTRYNFQHPPLIKYLFGFSIFLTGNPFYVQAIFGLTLLFITYFLGTKILKNQLLALVPVMLLLTDPLYGSMMTETLLDLGQAVFALAYITLIFLYPESYILQGLVLGLFAASKFWSTAIVFVILIYGYKLFIKKEKLNLKGGTLSFVVAFAVFALTYLVSLTRGLNMFFFLAKDLKYMLAHDSAGVFGGTILLFLKGYVLWPISLLAGIYPMFKTKVKDIRFFFLILPIIYLLSLSTALPFTRYFLLILPILYINLIFGTSLLVQSGSMSISCFYKKLTKE